MVHLLPGALHDRVGDIAGEPDATAHDVGVHRTHGAHLHLGFARRLGTRGGPAHAGAHPVAHLPKGVAPPGDLLRDLRVDRGDPRRHDADRHAPHARGLRPDPSLLSTQVLWWFLLVLYAVFFITPIVLTYMNRKEHDFWSWLAITYRDNVRNNLIVDYIVALMLVLGPQALWDFLVLPPISMPQVTAGLITLGAEFVAWALIYYWFTSYRNINATHFSRKYSLVWFGEFVFIVGGLQLANGVVYVIAAEFLNTMLEAEQLLAGSMAVVLLIAIILFFSLSNRRREELRRLQKKRDQRNVEDDRLLEPNQNRVTRFAQPLGLSMART